MRNFLFLFIGLLLLTSCQDKTTPPVAEAVPEMDPNMEIFESNVATAKAYIAAFCANDSTKMFSYVTDDFIWSPPKVGQDSLPRATWEEAMKGFMDAYSDKELTMAQYYAGLGEDQKPNGDVRVYGLWNSTFAESGKDSKLKWYAVLFFNEEGKIVHSAEWYDTADLEKEF